MPRPVCFTEGLPKEMSVRKAVRVLEEAKDCLPRKYYCKRQQFDEIIDLLQLQRRDIYSLRLLFKGLNENGLKFEEEIILEVGDDEK